MAAGSAVYATNASAGLAQPLQPQPVAPATGDVSGLVASVQPAVVNITVEQIRRSSSDGFGRGSPLDEFFRDFGGRSMPREGKQIGAGSGFIVDDKGHVVTNAHVINGADTVKVKLFDERELQAKVLGKDERLDVAVLQISNAKNLPHVALGSSTNLKVGEPVVAIGNPFGLGGTVTTGIVSAKSRMIGAGPYDDFIQTDASINPGNSGGPLFDARGQVIGMNTAINANAQGIGFAIPSDAIREVLPQLIEHGRVRRGMLGVHIQGVDEPLAKALALGGTRGALVGDMEKNGAGAKAGLREGDVITAVDGKPVAHAQDLPRMVASHAPGSRVNLEVKRGGNTIQVPVTLGELADEKPASAEREERQGTAGPLGIQLGNAKEGGALVARVSPTGPAAGLLAPGDVIVEVDGQPVKTAAEAATKLQRGANGKPLLLRVQREGHTRFVAIEREAAKP